MTLYKGRINSKPDKLMDALNKSLPVDIRFMPFDLETNRVWAEELEKINILTPKEVELINKALNEISKDFEAGKFNILPDDEDIHTLTERLLTEKLGDTGAKIHTGRSRNDQVACDLFQYLRASTKDLQQHLLELINTLVNISDQNKETLLAGTTHLQPAQPITLAHFLLSLAFALIRDYQRLGDAQKRIDRCPLGSGAIAGCGFPVNRESIASNLNFSTPTFNSIDSISDRDTAQEVAFACSALLCHISRYAEQFIIWSNPAFGYVNWDSTWSTGSSMMPQKRNPDAMELVRAKAARAIGNCTTLLTLTKGLPMTYAKDLQEDKEAVFDSIDTALITVQVFEKALGSATFNPKRMEAVLTSDMLATDIADALTQKGVPFRKAHERTAAFITTLETENSDLLSVFDQRLKQEFPEIENTDFQLGYKQSLLRRNATGGTSPDSAKKQIEEINKWISSL